jgi:7-cyano-7-deazaguanine reductase
MARTKSANGLQSLKLLGKQSDGVPEKVAPEVLETFENRYPHRDYLIRFDAEDFTSLCPVTRQPDFAALEIEYIAAKRCIETKSLKFYLGSYRNCAAFNEEVANRILEDLVTACAPKRMRVVGRFASRGGISVTVEAQYSQKAPRK